MPKRVVKSAPLKKSKPSVSSKAASIEKILVENFVALQKVMVNTSSKIDNLTKQLSKLLELFEVSAKTLASKELDLEKKGNKIVIEKIDSLIEQNKIIARGLTLVHERISEEPTHPEPQTPPQQTHPQQMPPQNMPKPQGMQGYQKSISSTPQQQMNFPQK